MKDQFTTYEIALKLKELGFNELCFGYYLLQNKEFTVTAPICNHKGWIIKGNEFLPCNDIMAPLWQQAITWFREKYDISIEIKVGNILDDKCYYFVIATHNKIYRKIISKQELSEKDYFNTLEQAILKAIELIENNTLEL